MSYLSTQRRSSASSAQTRSRRSGAFARMASASSIAANPNRKPALPALTRCYPNPENNRLLIVFHSVQNLRGEKC
jgi:hypothetical protein